MRKIQRKLKGPLSGYYVINAEIINPQVYSSFYGSLSEKLIAKEIYLLLQKECGGKGVYKSGKNCFIIVKKFMTPDGNEHSRYVEMQDSAERIVKLIKGKKLYASRERGNEYYRASVAIGVGADSILFPEIEASKLISLAGFAKIKAAEKGENFMVADDPMRILKREMDTFYAEIENGMHLDEFEPFFMPVVEAKNVVINGGEALVRWNKDKYRIIEAAKFKDIVQEKNMFVSIDMRVIVKSFAYFRYWKEQGLIKNGFVLSINISYGTLTEVFAGELKAIAKEAGLNPAEIEFDIEFDRGISEELKAAANAIKDCGFRIAYDIGNLNNISVKAIAEIPFDTIKISVQGLSGAAQCDKQRRLYHAIINMAADIGSTVIAKGVENAAHLSFVREMGIKLAQGYYFTRALNNSDFSHYLQKYTHSIA